MNVNLIDLGSLERPAVSPLRHSKLQMFGNRRRLGFLLPSALVGASSLVHGYPEQAYVDHAEGLLGRSSEIDPK